MDRSLAGGARIRGVNLQALSERISTVARLSGEFRLRSGMTASTYFDKYQFECDPELLGAVVQHMKDLIPADTGMLAGLELGGVPIATALSLSTGLPTVFVRKTAKEYGTARLAEGPSIVEKKLLVVEDVVTTGGQIVRSTEDLRERGGIVTHAVCVIDREQGGPAALEAIGVELRALFLDSDLT